jgi:hypothetical protein
MAEIVHAGIGDKGIPVVQRLYGVGMTVAKP